MFKMNEPVFITSIKTKGIVKDINEKDDRYKITFFKGKKRLTTWFDRAQVDVFKTKTNELNSDRVRGFDYAEGDFNREDIILPTRGTKKAAGYDLHAIADVTIPPRATVLIPTGVTTYMQDDEWLEIKARSGHSLKKYTAVGAGTIDADYYPKPMGVIIHSQNDEPITFSKGDAIAQAIFQKYLLADGDEANAERQGGFNSTKR